MQKIINVSNRLPINYGKVIKKSSGGLVSALKGMGSDFEFTWIGWSGVAVESEKKKKEIEEKLNDFNYHPIHLTRREVEAYYDGFSNSSLWPLLHYMTVYSNYDDKWYEVYEKVNSLFCEEVIKIANESDLIWIHDYHLMLLPRLLKKKKPNLKIGFFLHTPFPSSEVFRCHPKRYELLKGLLGANLIGFHTFGYLRHFRSSVLRILGIEVDINCIKHLGRKTHVGVYPIGINWDSFNETLKSQEYKKQLERYRFNYKNKKIILSVERLDYTKGILKRLQAIEKFLADNRESREHVVFIFIAVPSRGEVNEYQQLIEGVEGSVGRINGHYATLTNSPLHFIHRQVDFTHLCALYSLAHVAMVTPLMDGMNLVAKEYVACKPEGDGCIILSEFAGAAQELFNAVMVNPYHVNEVSQAIKTALELPDKDLRKNMQLMRKTVITNDSTHWAKTFIRDLKEKSVSLKKKISGINFQSKIVNQFKKSGAKAIFLDYDGTVREFEFLPESAIPTADFLECLEEWQKREDIDVYIISGRKKDFLEQHFGNYGVTLIAEHGFYFKTPNALWQTLVEEFNTDWKKNILGVFKLYSQSTPGSSIEIKKTSIVWHYRKSDPEFGKWKADEMLGDLTEVISNLPVEIHKGKKIIEVSSQQVNKGMAMKKFIQEKNHKVVLCAGDDQTDESMFHDKDDFIYSVKIGEGDTEAKYRIDSPKKFRRLLKEI